MSPESLKKKLRQSVLEVLKDYQVPIPGTALAVFALQKAEVNWQDYRIGFRYLSRGALTRMARKGTIQVIMGKGYRLPSDNGVKR